MLLQPALMPKRVKAPTSRSTDKLAELRRLASSTSGEDVMAILRENLQLEIAARKSNMKKFSLEAHLGETYVRDIIERGQNAGITNLVALARQHKMSIDRLVNLETPANVATKNTSPLKVVGEVGAGKWYEVDDAGQLLDFEREDSPLPADPKYPHSAQFDLIVRGTSINRFALDGMRLRCVDIKLAGVDVFDGDLVILQRTRDQGRLIQTTAKRLRRKGPTIELWPDSDDPKWQEPERIDTRKSSDHEEASIIALVLYAYAPARNPRNRR